MSDDKHRKRIDDIYIDCDDHYIGLVRIDNPIIRVPFYEVNEPIMIFQNRISIFYKKTSIATWRADEEEIMNKAKELKRTNLEIRKSNQGGV